MGQLAADGVVIADGAGGINDLCHGFAKAEGEDVVEGGGLIGAGKKQETKQG